MEGEGELESVGATGLISTDAKGLGGHSLFSLTSSFAASPAICDETLELRRTTGTAGEACRFPCCSKRPMRLATLWRGLSSGRGLWDEDGALSVRDRTRREERGTTTDISHSPGVQEGRKERRKYKLVYLREEEMWSGRWLRLPFKLWLPTRYAFR